MRRGEIYWADLGALAGRRPVVILTRTVAIPVLDNIVVVPITSTVRGIASEVALGLDEGVREGWTANCDSLATIPKTQLDGEPLGALDISRIPELNRALRFSLEILY